MDRADRFPALANKAAGAEGFLAEEAVLAEVDSVGAVLAEAQAEVDAAHRARPASAPRMAARADSLVIAASRIKFADSCRSH